MTAKCGHWCVELVYANRAFAVLKKKRKSERRWNFTPALLSPSLVFLSPVVLSASLLVFLVSSLPLQSYSDDTLQDYRSVSETHCFGWTHCSVWVHFDHRGWEDRTFICWSPSHYNWTVEEAKTSKHLWIPFFFSMMEPTLVSTCAKKEKKTVAAKVNMFGLS